LSSICAAASGPVYIPPIPFRGTAVKQALIEPRQLDRLRRKIDLAIAGSYCIDLALLLGFVAVGCIPISIPLTYGLSGFTECAVAFWIVRSFLARHMEDQDLALLRLVPSCVIQLVFVAIVPQLGFFFLGTLFIVFGFASLAVRARAAAVVWIAVALLCGYILGVVPEVYLVPHATAWQRVLVGGSVMLSLARCSALGVFSSHLRSVLGCRYLSVKRSLRSSEDDRTRTAAMLHEDLGQDLVGISLQLSASASRLARKGVPEAQDLQLAAEQLRVAIQKTRILAIASRPAPRPGSATEAAAKASSSMPEIVG